MANTPTKRLPKILGRAMTYNKRFDEWRWTPRRGARAKHLSVAICENEGRLVARLWAFGVACYIDEVAVADVNKGAKWAEAKIRGLLKALGVTES